MISTRYNALCVLCMQRARASLFWKSSHLEIPLFTLDPKSGSRCITIRAAAFKWANENVFHSNAGELCENKLNTHAQKHFVSPLSLSLSHPPTLCLRCMQPLLMEPHWLLNIIPLLGEMKLENSVNISDVDRNSARLDRRWFISWGFSSFFSILVL